MQGAAEAAAMGPRCPRSLFACLGVRKLADVWSEGTVEKEKEQPCVSAQKFETVGGVWWYCWGHLCQVGSVVSAAALQRHLLLIIPPQKAPFRKFYPTGLIKGGAFNAFPCFFFQNLPNI